MVFDYEEDISVVWKIYMKPYFKMQTSIHDFKMRKNKKNDNKFFCNFYIKVCASKSVYFQGIRAFVKVYRFACAHFISVL